MLLYAYDLETIVSKCVCVCLNRISYNPPPIRILLVANNNNIFSSKYHTI